MDANRENPLVSIVINNYNYGHFLSKAIDSALAQTYPSIEVIVVDDGSTDNSREVISSYGEYGVIPVLKENGGQASAMNAGFAQARGELIYFLDSDDMALPECVDRVVDCYLSAQNKPALINFRLGMVDEYGKSLGRCAPPVDVRLPSRDVGRQLRRKGTFRHQPTSANVFSGAALRKVMPMPEDDFRTCAETYLCYLAPLFGEVEAVEETLAQYRIHQNNGYNRAAKFYTSDEVSKYIKRQESFYRQIDKSRNQLIESSDLEIGGNARLLYMIFKLADRRLSMGTITRDRKIDSLMLAIESMRELRRNDLAATKRRRFAVMLYLACIALLPKMLVCPLIKNTFIQSPKILDFLVKVVSHEGDRRKLVNAAQNQIASAQARVEL